MKRKTLERIGQGSLHSKTHRKDDCASFTLLHGRLTNILSLFYFRNSHSGFRTASKESGMEIHMCVSVKVLYKHRFRLAKCT